jgi:RNA polymerase sigma factor (TIGR02999 family)
MADVTHLLDAVAAGDRKAAADLLPLVYDELRKLAAARMAGESPEHTLQPTALVHEAYLRLVRGGDDHRWDGRGHFFAAAAEAMRRILIESARRNRGPERGGEFTRHDLDPDQPPRDRTDPNTCRSLRLDLPITDRRDPACTFRYCARRPTPRRPFGVALWPSSCRIRPPAVPGPPVNGRPPGP